MSGLLCDNEDVMASLLRALSDPGQITDRAPHESLTSWQRRAVIEHAAPYIQAAERERIRQMADERAGEIMQTGKGCGADAEALWAFAGLLGGAA